MAEHLTQIQLERYGNHTLPAGEFLSASRHLGYCETCRLKLEGALDEELFQTLKADVFSDSPAEREHLTFESTAAYVEEMLSEEERQVVTDHLTGCEQCTMAVDDLRAFRNQVLPDLDREYPQPLMPVRTGTSWRRFVEAMHVFWPKSPALVFGAALLLIAAGWLIWRTMDRNEKDQKMARIAPSTTVTPLASPIPAQHGAEAMVIAQLKDGAGELVLDGNGKLSGVDLLPPDYQRRVREALSAQRLVKSPLLAGLTRAEGALRKGGEKQANAFSVLDPVGIVLLTDRPTFRWSPLEGAAGYIVGVYDDKLNQVMVSSQLTDTSWTPPQSLRRGGIYSWQVTAIKGGEEILAPRLPAPTAKFRLLDAALANEVIRARREYAASHLALGMLYTQAGLLDEAEREFLALQKANPNSTIPRRLLADLQTMRR